MTTKNQEIRKTMKQLDRMKNRMEGVFTTENGYHNIDGVIFHENDIKTDEVYENWKKWKGDRLRKLEAEIEQLKHDIAYTAKVQEINAKHKIKTFPR